MMGFIERKKQEMIETASKVIGNVFKTDIIRLLGDDARPEDVAMVTKYFDDGLATKSAKEALKKAGIIS